jgi:hypothetical protein
MRLDYALSREGPLNKKGGKMYIQDKASALAHIALSKFNVDTQPQLPDFPPPLFGGKGCCLFPHFSYSPSSSQY